MTKTKVLDHYLANTDKVMVKEEDSVGSYVAVRRGAMTLHAYRRLQSWEAAEDAVQEAYLRALQFQGSFDEDKDFDNWFYIILMNVVNSTMRNEGIAPEMVEADDDSLFADEFIEQPTEPDIDLTEKQYWDKLEEICSSVSKRDSSILTLYYKFGHSRPEISQMLDIKEPTVNRVLYVNKKRILGGV